MTKDTDDGAPLLVIKEITALLGSEAVISFYFLSLLLKCFSNNSANAISNVIIISNSANVTYIHITSPHCFEGRKRNVSLPSDRGKQPPPFWCPPGAYICAVNILPHFVENVNTFRRTHAAHSGGVFYCVALCYYKPSLAREGGPLAVDE